MTSFIVILIICSVTIAIIFLLLDYFRSEIINLGEIENQDKEEMLKLMKISFINNNIDMDRLEIPKIYNNIYYRIYFLVHTTEDVIEDNRNKIQSNMMHLSYEKLGIVEEKTEYCCTISNYNNTGIELLDRMQDKYRMFEKR